MHHWMVLLLAGAVCTTFAEEPCRVLPDGSILATLPALTGSGGPGAERQPVKLSFGLPSIPPQRRWLEQEKLPICHTRWETNGILYEQTVLVTALGEGTSTQTTNAIPVLLVHVVGENTNTDYTDASAVFAVAINGQRLPLELQEGLIQRVTKDNQRVLLAAMDIPVEGIRTNAGPALVFHGHMPPASQGSMTLKVPLAKLADEGSVRCLVDLEFDRELNRVTRAWTAELQTGPVRNPPVVIEASGR